jgi:protease I
MRDISGKKVLILATHGFEQSELEVPRDRLKAAGATVEIASPEAGEIKGWQKKDWGAAVKVDKSLDDVRPGDYDAIVLPGGQMNPDTLRGNRQALDLIRAFFDAGKVVAAVCHAPWLLIDTGIARGRQVTSWPTVRTDLENAGANWTDAEVVTDKGLVTSRKPADLEAFSAKIAEEIAEGRHERRRAA